MVAQSGDRILAVAKHLRIKIKPLLRILAVAKHLKIEKSRVSQQQKRPTLKSIDS